MYNHDNTLVLHIGSAFRTAYTAVPGLLSVPVSACMQCRFPDDIPSHKMDRPLATAID